MARPTPFELYRQYVVAHDLERRAIFEQLSARRETAAVLYPGCFLHVTPSFYFQHVVYVDKNDLAATFFHQLDGVLDLVSAAKSYRAQPHVRFLHQDYSAELPLQEQRFDLLLALFAPGVLAPCGRYLRPGGLLLANDSHGEATLAAADPAFELVAVVQQRGKGHVFEDDRLDQYFVPKPAGGRRRDGQHDQNQNGRYLRVAHAYLFQKKV